MESLIHTCGRSFSSNLSNQGNSNFCALVCADAASLVSPLVQGSLRKFAAASEKLMRLRTLRMATIHHNGCKKLDTPSFSSCRTTSAFVFFFLEVPDWHVRGQFSSRLRQRWAYAPDRSGIRTRILSRGCGPYYFVDLSSVPAHLLTLQSCRIALAFECRHSLGFPLWEHTALEEPHMFLVFLVLRRSPRGSLCLRTKPRRIRFSGELLTSWSLLRPSLRFIPSFVSSKKSGLCIRPHSFGSCGFCTFMG